MHVVSGDAAPFIILVGSFFSVDFGYVFDNFIDKKINLIYWIFSISKLCSGPYYLFYFLWLNFVVS